MTIGVKHDRFVLTAQYRERKKYTRTYSLIYWSGGSGYIYQMQKLNGNGLCFELKSSLVEQQNKNWKLYTMIFQDNYSIKYPSTIVPVDGLLLDGGKAPWRGGLKTSATFKRIFLQASFLFSLNELTTDKSGNTDYDADRYNNNFLLVGYTVALKKSGMKNLQLNAQSRSLFYSHSYPLAKYVGIGAQLNF